MTANTIDVEHRLDAPERLADLEASGLLDATALDALDALTRAAHIAFGAGTTAAVTAVTADEQVVVSVFAEGGMLPPGSTVPLTHSLCKQVVMAGEPYVVDDATADPGHGPAVRDLGVGAYIGSPLRGTKGTVVGAMCVVTAGPRAWTAQELSLLSSLAAAAETVITLHSAARTERIARSSGAVPVEAAARVQHDLRTPLTSLLGFLEVLLDDSGADALKDGQLYALRRSHASAERLLEAVDYLDHPTPVLLGA
jgi:signal transduction histidine kinase